MSKSLTTEAKVGLLTLAAILALLAVTFKVGRISFGKPKGYYLIVSFKTLGGLDKGADVMVAGVKVGRVEDIALEEDRARVLLRLEEWVRIRDNAKVSVATKGVMGDRYIEIFPGTPTANTLPSGSKLTGQEPANIDEMLIQLSQISDDVAVLVSSLRELITPEEEGPSSLKAFFDKTAGAMEKLDHQVEVNGKALEETLAEFKTMASRLTEVIDENRDQISRTVTGTGDLISDLRGRISETADSINDLTVTAKEAVQRADQNLNREFERVGEAMESLKADLKGIEEVVDNLTEVTRKIRDGEGTIGKLVADDSLYQKLDGAVGSLNEIGQDLKEGKGTVGKLLSEEGLYEKVDKTLEAVEEMVDTQRQLKLFLGFESWYLSEPDRGKAIASLRFQPREGKYYEIGIVDTPYKTRTETVTRFQIEEGGTVTAEEVTTEETYEDRILINALIAQRFGPVWLRGGVIESTGGVGIDAYPIDRLRLTAEIWDFGREDWESHLHLGAAYRFYKGLYLSAGWDDVLNEDADSPYIGLGLRFEDQDLKNIAGKLPTPGF